MAARYAACASCMGGIHSRTRDSVHYGTGIIESAAPRKVKEILLRTFPYKAQILAAKRTFQRFAARSPGGGASYLNNSDEVRRRAIRK